jgi:hypothetical protein
MQKKFLELRLPHKVKILPDWCGRHALHGFEVYLTRMRTQSNLVLKELFVNIKSFTKKKMGDENSKQLDQVIKVLVASLLSLRFEFSCMQTIFWNYVYLIKSRSNPIRVNRVLCTNLRFA